MFIDSNGKSINIHAAVTIGDTVYPNLLDPVIRALAGVTEIADPTPPDDYSEATYFRTEQSTAPYLVFTKKSDAVLTAANNNRVLAQINALEATAVLPRVTREFLIGQLAASATAQGVDPTTNPAYVKLKALDDQVTALRAQLR